MQNNGENQGILVETAHESCQIILKLLKKYTKNVLTYLGPYSYYIFVATY